VEFVEGGGESRPVAGRDSPFQIFLSAGAAVVVAILTLDEFVISLTSGRDLSRTARPRSIRIMLRNSRPRHTWRPRRNRRDLTPALVSWMLADAYPEEILYGQLLHLNASAL
jgi:hypothetical protein